MSGNNGENDVSLNYTLFYMNCIKNNISVLQIHILPVNTLTMLLLSQLPTTTTGGRSGGKEHIRKATQADIDAFVR